MHYLLQFRPVEIAPGGRFVVQGFLRSGGLSVGILRDNRWQEQAHVMEPGPFVVVLATSSPGPGSLVVATNLQNGALKNEFDINRAGWLAADAPP